MCDQRFFTELRIGPTRMRNYENVKVVHYNLVTSHSDFAPYMCVRPGIFVNQNHVYVKVY